MLTAIGASTQGSCPAAEKDTGLPDVDRKNGTLNIDRLFAIVSGRPETQDRESEEEYRHCLGT